MSLSAEAGRADGVSGTKAFEECSLTIATVRPTMNEKLRGLAAKGLTQSEAARKLGVSRQRVSQIAAKFDLAFRRGAPPLPEERLRELASKGLTKSETARQLGVPLARVRSQGERLQLSFAPAWSRPKAAATKFGRILQAARLGAGYSRRRLGALSGLNTQHLKAIERGLVRRPGTKTIRALADCLDGHTTYDELIRAVPPHHPPVSEQKLMELAKKSMTRTEAARELGLSHWYVRKLATKLGVSFAPALRRPKAPTTEFGRILQAARLASGYSYARLAVESGINRHHLIELDLGRIRRPKEKTLRTLADCLDGPALYEDLVRAVHEAAAPVQREAHAAG